MVLAHALVCNACVAPPFAVLAVGGIWQLRTASMWSGASKYGAGFVMIVE